ncbi:MAG: response regulator transcription factor [Deltaproteobacteria bacterium]|nr:response regulator transcription factor [Deltaproteobacteria bacterium]
MKPDPEVLVVDDDPRLREVVRYTLARAGFRVREASDGRSAIAEVRASRPDLVLLDVLMPGLDGISACRELRAEHDLPVVFLSSRGEEIDRVLGLDLGGDDYIAKPFSPAELVSRIRAVLRRSARAAPREELVESGVRVDVRAHRAFVGEAELELTATEFRMLAALLGDPGAVVTRAAMVRAAYGGPHHVSERTLDSHVRGVRNKLRAQGVDRVVTVTAVGWRWDPGA